VPPSRPTAAELVEAVREFLEREVLPALPAEARFQCRIAINVLAIVRRELELRPALDTAERERLAMLLGPASADGSIDALNRRLAQAIRDGSIGVDGAELGEHLRRTIGEALQINNPRWLQEPS
jgi:hypothetical protein